MEKKEFRYIPLLNMEIIKKSFEIVPDPMHEMLLGEIKSQLNRAFERDRKPMYWIGSTGNKYPYHNQKYNLHKDQPRFAPLGNGGQMWNGEYVHDLPKNEYPYKIQLSR